MPDWLLILLGGLAGNIVGIYAIISGRHKIKAEAEKIKADASETVSDTAVKLLAPMQARIDRLETRLTQVETENESLARQVREFRELIRRLWILVVANDIKADANLAAAVEKALGDHVA